MTKPINDNEVIHKNKKAYCPFCKQELKKKKYQTFEMFKNNIPPHWKWMHLKPFGLKIDFTDTCPSESSQSFTPNYGIKPHNMDKFTRDNLNFKEINARKN